jgi:hypothetical protein
MFERTERARRYTSNFRTSLILSSFAAINYLTDKDPGLTTLCSTLAFGFGLRGLYEMDQQGRLIPKLRQLKRNLFFYWERAPDLGILRNLAELKNTYRNSRG